MAFIPDDEQNITPISSGFVPDEPTSTPSIFQTNQAQPPRRFLDRLGGVGNILGSVFGGKQIGEYIGTKIAEHSPEAQRLRQIAPEYQGKFIFQTPTKKQLAGDVLQIGATLGAAALPEIKTASMLGRIGKTAGVLGGLSGIAGAGQALSENQSPIKGALTAGATGAVLGGTGATIGELAHYLTSPAISEGIYNRVLGISPKVIEKGKSPAGMLLQEGIGGTKFGIRSKAQILAKNSGKEIQQILESKAQELGSISSQEVKNQIQSALQEKFQNTLSKVEIKNMVDSLPLNALRGGRINYPKLNALRSEIDHNFLGNAKWLNDSTAEKTIGLKTAANVIRGIVQSADERLPEIFDKYSKAITTVRSLDKNLAKPHLITTLLELLSASGIEAMLGASRGVRGLTEGALGFGGYKALRSAPVLTGIARGLQAISKTSPVARFGSGLAKIATPGIAKKIIH